MTSSSDVDNLVRVINQNHEWGDCTKYSTLDGPAHCHCALQVAATRTGEARTCRWDGIVEQPSQVGGVYATLAVLVARMKQEIVDDMAEGTVPATVRDFASLHDYVDANEYGGLCSDNAHLSTEFVAVAQHAVDGWLRSRASGAE